MGWESEWERDRQPEPERSFTRSGEGHLIRDIVGEKYIINKCQYIYIYIHIINFRMGVLEDEEILFI